MKNFDRDKKGDRPDEFLNNEGLDSLEARRSSDLNSEEKSENLAEDDSEKNGSVVFDAASGERGRVEKSLAKRTLRFIPKFVRTPRSRADEGLILKRATSRQNDEDAHPISKSNALEKIGLRSLIANPGVVYQLLDSFPQLLSDVTSTAPEIKDGVACSSETDRDEWNADFYQESASVSGIVDLKETCDLPSASLSFQAQTTKSDLLSLAKGRLENVYADVSTGVREILSAFSLNDSVENAFPIGAPDVVLRPYEFFHGASRSFTPYPFAELGEKENDGILQFAVPEVSNATCALTRDEVLEEISAVYGQSERILLLVSNTYLAVDGSDEEEETPVLSAEDQRLAELLGRLPNAFELSEYYWEPVKDAEEDEASSNDSSILSRVFYAMSAPPVFVGRMTIRAFQKFFLFDVSRSDSLKATRGSNEVKTRHRAMDVAVPMVAGIVLAVCVIFPALKYVVEEVFTTVAKSKVRQLDGNVTSSGVDSEFDVIPLISEQILFPRYEAVEFDVGADGASSMENDGYPVIMQRR